VLNSKQKETVSKALLIAQIAAILIIVSIFLNLNGDICYQDEYNHQKDCASYNIALVFLWQIIKAANDYGVAITALATIVIAIFTRTLWLASVEQSRLTRESIDLARAEYISTHRPRLRIRRVRARLTDGEAIVVHFVVLNCGDTNAKVDRYEATLHVCTGPGKDAMQERLSIIGADLVGGQSELIISAPSSFIFSSAWKVGERHSGAKVEVRGTFEYADDNNVVRRTGIWRVYSADSARFEPVDDPDYEYED
jgi:hypothetical protein